MEILIVEVNSLTTGALPVIAAFQSRSETWPPHRCVRIIDAALVTASVTVSRSEPSSRILFSRTRPYQGLRRFVLRNEV